MWRLTAIVWAFGAGLLFVWSDEVLRDPLANVCAKDVDPPHVECLTEEARRLAESGSLAERLVARVRGDWNAIDETRTVRRLTSERYRGAALSLLRREALWAAATWGVYALLVWVGTGFRSRPAPPAPREPGGSA